MNGGSRFHRRAAVRQAESDREILLQQAYARVDRAEHRASQLEAELASARDRSAATEAEVEELRRRIEELEPAPPATPSPAEPALPPTAGPAVPPTAEPAVPPTAEPAALLGETMLSVVDAARQAADRIVQDAEEASRRQVEHAARAWLEASERVTNISAWAEAFGPALRDARARAAQVRVQLDVVSAALGALVDQVGGLTEALDALDSSAGRAPGDG